MPHRLLIWTENYWVGGCDRFLADLVAGLRDAPVGVVLAGNRHPEFDAWLEARVPWALPREIVDVANMRESPLAAVGRRVGGGDGAHEGAPSSGFSVYGAGVAAVRYEQALRNERKLRRLIRRLRPDSILINNGGYPGGESCRLVPLAAKAEGIGRVVHFVHNMAYPPGWPMGMERRLDRRIDDATDLWLTAAHRASDQLSAAREIPREHIETVHYGIPLPETQAEIGDVTTIAVVANFERRKGHRELFEALATLRDRTLKVRLVGDGEERAALEVLRRKLGLEETVEFLGWRTDVDQILDESDLLVLPSLANECLPYAILEAMGHGLPVVSTDVAGIPEEIVDGETGYVVAPGDASALAAAIARVCDDPEAARRLGAAGRERVRTEFSLERMVGAMREALALPD